MVTTVGYQRGAKRIAETYGGLVLELREPTPVELDNRVMSINLTMNFVVPVVTDVAIVRGQSLVPAGADCPGS